MASTQQWNEYNQAGAIKTANISNINMGNADIPNLNPADYPIKRGENSYDKYLTVEFGGTFNKIWNIICWRSDSVGGDGPSSIATGITLVGECSGVTYATPTTLDIGAPELPYLEASGLVCDPAALTLPGETGYIHLQLQTTSLASLGDTPNYYVTVRFDEQ
jgi:hypothetical protein